ncbi:hypothetical protein SNE40_014114 [Patella caerulea]|uniref:Galaxin-like repeats domain-containing protein n=1 Tax=Patella caerulea TaxID=87958 RepID=A0AAN8JKL2_PATCE
MNTRLLTTWLVLLVVCIVYVKSEWKDPGTPLKSPFAPPEGKTVQVAKNSGDLHRSDTRKHSHSKNKHTHHDPRGDKILPTRRKVSGQCAGRSYVPRTHICCNGKIIRRQGMRPACCGDVVYDFVFDLCCEKNEVRPRTVGRPFC